MPLDTLAEVLSASSMRNRPNSHIFPAGITIEALQDHQGMINPSARTAVLSGILLPIEVATEFAFQFSTSDTLYGFP